MKQKFLILLLIGVLLCCSTVLAQEINCSKWAKTEISFAQKCGILDEQNVWGYQEPMKRGELAPILLRAYENVSGLEAPKADTSYFSDASYEADALYLLGVMNGVGEGKFSPEALVTREQIAKIILSLQAVCEDEELILPPAFYNPLTDFMAVSHWAKPYVELAYNKGIIAGYEDGTFRGENTVSREEAVVLVVRSLKLCELPKKPDEIPSEEEEFPESKVLSWNVEADWEAGEHTILWSRLAKGTEYTLTVIEQRNSRYEGDIKPNGPLEYRYTDGCSHTLYLYPNRTYQFSLSANGQTLETQLYIPKRNTEEMDLIRENLPDTKEEADILMETITVPVWKMKSDGTKYESSAELTVHVMIAEKVVAVFTEIFNGEEQFPIKDLGGYAFRGGTTEHNWGTAIDLNANENYCLYKDGTTVGECWLPYENPYSVTPYGDVVNTFEKYGFTWGGDAWSNPKDYMHFSYLGT